jgi:hypothetical protein
VTLFVSLEYDYDELLFQVLSVQLIIVHAYVVFVIPT